MDSVITSLFFLLVLLPVSRGEDDPRYAECQQPFVCGLLDEIPYPFYGNVNQSQLCGHGEYRLLCEEDQYPIINIADKEFRVLKINDVSKEMTMVPKVFWDNTCPGDFFNISLNETLFNVSDYYMRGIIQNISLFYDCSDENIPSWDPYRFQCSIDGEQKNAYFATPGILAKAGAQNASLPRGCSIRIEVPVLAALLPPNLIEIETLQQILRSGFHVSYEREETMSTCRDCGESHGICGTNMTSPDLPFACLCQDQPYPETCPVNKKGDKVNVIPKIIIGLVGAFVMTAICAFLFCLRKTTNSITFFWKKEKKNEDVEAFIRNYGPLAPKRYSYSDVKRMTGFFKDKLGQGGYGGVYKGKLHDGRLVAVKVLKESKGNGEEFINEVASISRTSHVNIVTLLGYCFQADKRVLIYEFMPNGSLDTFVHNKKGVVKANHQHLGWKKLYEIAVGVARGLEYLHRGCNTRIVHFDIKPHNILLDEDFRPKISDFGLAKLCKREESILSMLGARGTIGYIAPEVFSRNFGGVSHKSDVYSYGMMILEMAGGTEKNDSRVETEHTSDLYFPHWIYKRLELGNGSEILGVSSAEDAEILQKMTLVGLWCIQTNPSARPSMSKVIEMLEGSIDALEIPPKPFLSSPSRQPLHFSTTSSMTQHDE